MFSPLSQLNSLVPHQTFSARKRTYARLSISIGVISLFTGTISLGQNASPVVPASTPQPSFSQTVAPFVQKNCAFCHNEKLKTGGLVLTGYHETASMLRDRDLWEKVVRRVRAGEMPPKGIPRPKPEAIASVTNWIEAQFEESDRTTPADPGRLTAHRLNRVEYDNTIRDLLAVNFSPATDFPADDSGYGFDNIGDVLSVSPVLMEKYLNAATKIANRAIPSGALPRPTRVRYSPEHSPNDDGMALENRFEFPAEADYDLRVAVSGRKDPFRLHLLLDGKEIKTSDVLIEKDTPRSYELKFHVPYGEHLLAATMESRTPSAEEIATAASLKAQEEASYRKAIAKHPEDAKEIARQRAVSNPPTYIDTLEVRGPYNPLQPPVPESYRRIFICGHPAGHHTAECARTDLTHLAGLAYRRPVTPGEVDRLVKLVASAQKDGMTFEQSMRVGLEAVLVSPNFLYRIERDPRPEDASAVHPVNDYELASRLSYFLWSSMPDEHLLQIAGEHRLHDGAVLSAEVKRMLQDPKSEALIENFFGQWLELRNLDSIRPDPDEFPQFNAQLRRAMYTESEMFVQSIVREDHSILDFLDGKYTFLNQRLAKFYGIPGVSGDQFRRVSLDGVKRSGVLTQASVLTVTSYPTRTSPVLRGKWILENVLNEPPPPPPPGVGSIDAKAGPLAGTMRQQMEKHRANPVCASCHTKMDPLGFALENYNAIGQWRTRDAGQPIDASGVLPDGKSFKGSAEMKTILAGNRDIFAECLTEKLMIYALGRGLEGYDRRAVKQITTNLSASDYRFSALISGIVNSVPFQMGRGDEGSQMTKAQITKAVSGGGN
jgi:mono/diheme cytochrome c family protein